MALGNANSSAQARGKAKPVMVKRRKEVVIAKSYVAITGSVNQGAVAGAVACARPNSEVTLNYYHDNIGSAAPQANSKVYSRPRANDRFLLTDGTYKVLAGGQYYAMIIENNVVRTFSVCK
tara:strand:+ start:706 stop:1068 length:363 start_codon:yes stop_codon:yes gene_type:complete